MTATNSRQQKLVLAGSILGLSAACILQQPSLAVISALVPISVKQRNQTSLIKGVEVSVKELHEKISRLEPSLDFLPSKTSRPLKPGERGRVGIFIDGSNLYFPTKELNLEMNFGLLLEGLIKGASEVVGPFYYTALRDKDRCHRKFLDQLEEMGYKVIKQQLVFHRNGVANSNVDDRIKADIIHHLEEFDTCFLATGDRGFIRHAQLLRKKLKIGKRVEIASFPSATNGAFPQETDEFIDVTQFCQKRKSA